MPLHLDDVDVMSDVRGLTSVLIVPCNMCPAITVAVNENRPFMQLFRNPFRSAPFDDHIRKLRSRLEREGVRADVFRSDLYHQFDITYPAGWRQYVDPGEEIPLFLAGPLDKDYRANVLMSYFELEYAMTPSQFAKAFGPSSTRLRDYELLSEESIRVDGYLAVRRVFSWTATDDRLRDVPVTVVQIHALVDEQALIITATTRSEEMEKYEPLFDGIIGSLDFH